MADHKEAIRAHAAIERLENEHRDLLAALERAARKLEDNSCGHENPDDDFSDGVADDCANCIVHAAIAKAKGGA